jgi:hypothetical protein
MQRHFRTRGVRYSPVTNVVLSMPGPQRVLSLYNASTIRLSMSYNAIHTFARVGMSSIIVDDARVRGRVSGGTGSRPAISASLLQLLMRRFGTGLFVASTTEMLKENGGGWFCGEFVKSSLHDCRETIVLKAKMIRVILTCCPLSEAHHPRSTAAK